MRCRRSTRKKSRSWSVKPFAYQEVARKLESAGFLMVSQKGSHVKCARSDGHSFRTAIMPSHREIAVGARHVQRGP
ncbi:MAG: type II toxin-antitoxin system HicA family toxin [Chloroflexota bacterium]|nr:type II toxin-antitoxin system HicA family toxin [Chloroflexota bacterium]